MQAALCPVVLRESRPTSAATQMPPRLREPGRTGNTREDRRRGKSPLATCTCDKCLRIYPDGHTVSRRTAARHAEEQFARDQAEDPEFAYAVAQSLANGESANNSDYEGEGDDDDGQEGDGADDVDLEGMGGDVDVGAVDVESGGDGHDGECAQLSGDELPSGDVSMADLTSSDSEQDTEDDEDDGGFGGSVPSVPARGTDPPRFVAQAGHGAAPIGNDQAGLPDPGPAPQAPNLRPAPRSKLRPYSYHPSPCMRLYVRLFGLSFGVNCLIPCAAFAYLVEL